jgi:hypothetical protein
MKIIQTTDAVTIERSFAGQPLNTETYTFDGKPVELTYPGTTVSRTLALSPDGKTITISSKYKVHRENEAAWEYTRSETYALAGDAKRLTLDRISVTPQGTEKVKAIYDKQ